MDRINHYLEKSITVIAVMMGIFHIYTAFFGTLTALLQRSVHLGFAMLLVYLIAARSGKTIIGKGINLFLCLIVMITIGYFLYDFQNLVWRYGQPILSDLVIGAVLILLVLDFSRRRVGNILPAISVVFLVYALAGPYLPGILRHRGYTIPRIIAQISLGTEGIFGTPLGVSANYIFLFVLLGTLLEASGIGQFYIDLAIKSVGRSPGGPAKAAVVASSFFGSVSGSAVANVAGTGAITIPLMKSIGYKPAFAGAVEAVASTGGQVMPPLMGASAFIMAEILGIPYYQVALGALIPALIYYSSVFSMVHFRALATGITGTDTSVLPSIRSMLVKRGVFLLPVLTLIYFLIFMRISVMKAAVYAVGVTILIGFIVSKTTIREFVAAFEKGARTALVVVTSTACAGIVVAVINLTGLGMKFSSVVLNAAGDNLLLVLIFLMFASLLLGMGLPTTPAYLILAVLGAPTMVRMGVDPLAAHMFVFYFGSISMITPPVALAVYAAATIAESEFWETAKNAVMLGLPAFIVPYMFVYSPSLLWKGTGFQIALAGGTALVGAVCLGAGLAGWFFTRATLIERGILAVAGLLLIQPGAITNLTGLGGMILIIMIHLRRRKNEKDDSQAEAEDAGNHASETDPTT